MPLFRRPTMPPGVPRALRLPASRAHLTRELEDEMRFHLEMRIAELVAGGMRDSDARSEALRRFGDPDDLREYCHSIEVPHMRRMHAREWVEGWAQDFRFASRQFRRAPGFVAVVVLTLALGIGATTAIFSVVNGVLLRALPYPDADRIVQLWELDERRNQIQVADANFDDLRTQSRSFATLAEMSGVGVITVTGTADATRARVAVVSHDFFPALGVRPVLGRLFVADEEQHGGRPAIVLAHAFWQRSFGGRAAAVGSVLRIGDGAYTVVGVMPAGVDHPAGVDLWVPRELDERLPSRTAHNWEVVGRLRPGTTLEQARRDVTTIAKRLKEEYRDMTTMTDVAVVPLREQIVGGTKSTLLLLLGASLVLLLIACANVVNLLVARMAARHGEVAVRLALGAARYRLVQQCLAESLILAVAGGAVGVLLAALGVKLLVALEPGNLPRIQDVRLDWPVLLFALAVSMLTAIGLGVLTAWRGTRGDLRSALSQSQRTQSGAGASERVRRILVVAQVALTLVLLVGAGLLARSFIRLLRVNPGFRTERAVVLDVSAPGDGPAGIRERVHLYDALIDRLRAIPGVTAVGGVNAMPLTSDATSNGTFLVMSGPDERIEPRDYEKLARDPVRAGQAEFRVASSGFFQAMGIPLVAGRLFDDRDAPDAPHVAVISATLARTKWPNQDPLGKTIQFGNMDGDLRTFTVVGVVGDIRHWSLGSKPQPTFYAFYRQRPIGARRLNIVLSTTGDPASLAGTAQRIARELRPDVPPRVRSIETIVAGSVATQRFVLFLVGVFGLAALVLATLGVYSVISYLVTQRSRELSIRIALGAGAGDIVRLVVGQGVALALIGIAVGALLSFAVTRLLVGLLYDVSPTDPWAFLAMTALLTVVALIASWLPARRAARVDAMDVLRGG